MPVGKPAVEDAEWPGEGRLVWEWELRRTRYHLGALSCATKQVTISSRDELVEK
jgi:hypothetical protein